MPRLFPEASGSLRRKTWLSIALCAAVLAGGAGAFAVLASLKQPPDVRETPLRVYNVEVFAVEPCDLQEIVASFGTARAEREVVLSAQVPGTVVEVHPRLRVGTRVEGPQIEVGEQGRSERSPGDLLVRIDPQTYQQRVAQASHRLAEDDADLDRLRQEQANTDRLLAKVRGDLQTYREQYDRIRRLGEQGVANKAELTRAELELKQYEEAILRHENEQKLFPLRIDQLLKRRETHRTERQLAQLDLDRTAVRPPFAGILSEIMVEEGQAVQTGTPLVRLTDLSRIEVPVPLTLRDYARIESLLRSGQRPHVALAENETAPSRWAGTVVRVAPQADELTRTIRVFVEVENREQSSPLLPGTFVHARIDGPLLRQAHVVPRDAIVNGRLFVTTENGGTAVREVTVERTLHSLAVVNSGLKPGDRVILTNLDVLHEGAPVRVESERTLIDELQRQRVKVARPVLAGGSEAEPVN